MSTYETRSPVGDDRIPDGYEVTFHQIRGYDSPDRWFVCTGPHGWMKEVGERRDAIRACVEHWEMTRPLAPDDDGKVRCYLCRGARDSSVEGRECPVCSGSSSITVTRMAETHDGRVRLAEVVGKMRRDGASPKWLRMLGDAARSSVETLSRNPCKACGTWLLEPGWVGSAYCSRRCCVEDYRDDPGYAGAMLESYTEEMVREREAAMLSIETSER